ncbi:hypothetical protein ACB092_02G108700 [Castanea dentata]
MAYKVISLFSFNLLLLFLLPLYSHATSRNPHDKKLSSVEYLKRLQGSREGDKVKGIHNLKAYLEKFGYLSYNHSKNQTHTNDDDSDELLVSAIKTYQLNHHLNATGIMDANTVSTMMKPRCLVADITNGTNWMSSRKKKHHHRHGSFHTHFPFSDGNRKWTTSDLTYGFLPSTPAEAMNPIANAFKTWASNSHFTFSQAQDYTNANIKVSFERGDHGDGSPFDGPNSPGVDNTVAHAFRPTDGRLHFDADNQWSVGAVPGAMDYETVALHEIGHLLGLGHSSVQGSVMWPAIDTGATAHSLQKDDIDRIKALYNS